jgi:hypothetical protein
MRAWLPRSAAVLITLALAAPAHAADTGFVDPSRSLGATSPTCREALDATLRARCEASGSVAQRHPLSSYGLDVNVGFSVTDPSQTFEGALQSAGAAVWTGVLYAVRGTLLLLEWTFALDLTAEAMPGARDALARLHGSVFGDGWLLLAVSVAGLWGIWRGLVQGRATETLAGLAATVALLVGGLVVIARPGETVGWVAGATNDAALAVLGAMSASGSSRSLGDAMADVFATTVEDPWCALQFGSVAYCRQPAGGGKTRGDLWLEHPAQSWQRKQLFELTAGDDGDGLLGAAAGALGLSDDRELPREVADQVREDPQRVALQRSGGTFPRLAILGMAVVGVAGAVALFLWLGVRLLLAAAMTLLLLLLAPAMLLAPAFGVAGRQAFLSWAQRLLGAVVAKFVFAVLLLLVLTVGRVFAALDLGWFAQWLLLGAFWWGVFVKRGELLELLSVGTTHGQGGGVGRALGQGYYAWMLGRNVAAVGAAPAAAASRAVRERRAARGDAVRSLAREELDRGRRAELTAGVQQAEAVVSERRVVRREAAAIDRRLRDFDDAAAVARATGAAAPAPTGEQRRLLERRDRLHELLDDPAARQSEQAVRHADRNRALTGEAVSERDLDVVHHTRSRDLREGAETTPRERRLDALATSGDRRLAKELLDPEAVRARTAERHAELRAERRRRRAGGRR